MKITPTTQSARPPGRPDIHKPVNVTLGVPLFYLQAKGHPVPWDHDIFCSDDYAVHVLALLNHWAQMHSFALVHLGFTVVRKARKRDGTPITPERWSNHSYGLAMDFAGIITNLGQGRYLDIDGMKDGCPAKLADLLKLIRSSILSEGRKPEIVDENDWIHLGIYPKGE